MGFLTSEKCEACGLPAGFQRGKLNDGSIICAECIKKASYGDVIFRDRLGSYSLFEIKQRLDGNIPEQTKLETLESKKEDERNQDLEANKERQAQFNPNHKIASYVWFDDDNKWFAIPKGFLSPGIEKSYVFSYDEIISFELLEDGHSVSKGGGLGKALVGGAVFGLAGALVGASSRETQHLCNLLEIKVTTRNRYNPLVFIKFIDSSTQKDSFSYKTIYESAQETMSKFEIIADQLSRESKKETVSAIEEIKKYKELLDMGIITEEEFTKKKHQLMGIE